MDLIHFCFRMKMLESKLGKILLVGQMMIILYLLVNKIKTDTDILQGQNARQSVKEHLLDKDQLFIDETGDTRKEQTISEETKSNISIKRMLSTKSTKLFLSTSSTHLQKVRKFQKQEQKMNERLSLIRKKCYDYMQNPYWRNLRLGGTIWTYEPKQIYYCSIPKVGCTFWKRIMRFIANDYPGNQKVQRPSDIDRKYVHYGDLSNLRKWSVRNPIVRMLMTNGNSFMFTRDPFSRLWSAYIDKFLLPGFWSSHAPSFVKKLRPNATEYERKCANDVTFEEFLLFITLTNKSGLNVHWDKMHRLCSPCHVQYDVIGKQESFRSDANFIFTKFGLEYLIENTTKLDMVYVETTTLTKVKFDLESSNRKGCFDKLDVAKKLWLAFQYNGYIDRNIDFPEQYLIKSNFLIKPIEVFTKLVLQTIENQTKRGVDISRQKREMMLEAYRKIPTNLLEAIVNVYEYDFELFGYSRILFP